MIPWRKSLLAAALLLGQAAPARAGMTVITLTDMARLRLDALSFFLFLYLLCAWLLKICWNQLSLTFPAMPRLRFGSALGLLFVTGLAFYVVLTMISGARELLTPGAWEKQGVGYRAREASGSATKDERHEALRRLRNLIWDHAAAHGGEAPASPFAPGQLAADWEYSGGGFYTLMPGVRPGSGRDILVFEPAAAGSRRLVLLSDGSIEDRAEGILKRQLEETSRP